MESLLDDAGALASISLTLTDDEAAHIRRQCRKAADVLGDEALDNEWVMAEVALVAGRLPARLIRALTTFRCAGNAYGALVVRNLPIDRDLPATPADGDLPDWHRVRTATIAQLAASSHLGDIIGFADEKQGRLVQDIIPVAGTEHSQENTGSVFLELHTENGFHPFKPDFLTLLCLRPDHDRSGRTIVGAVARIIPRLSRTCAETLRQPLFRIRYSSSFARSGSSGWSPPVAVLSGPVADPELTADFHAMEPMTRGARWALEELETVLSDALIGTALEPGTLLVVDNRAAVHGRTGFTARHDGTDRWLRRCFTVTDLRRSRGSRAPGSRVCEPLTATRARGEPAASTSVVAPGRRCDPAASGAANNRTA